MDVYANYAELKDALSLTCRGFVSLGNEGRQVATGRSRRFPISQALVAAWTDKFYSRNANRNVPNLVAPAARDQGFGRHFNQTFMKWHKNQTSFEQKLPLSVRKRRKLHITRIGHSVFFCTIDPASLNFKRIVWHSLWTMFPCSSF
jgi:hypothetical protein